MPFFLCNEQVDIKDNLTTFTHFTWTTEGIKKREKKDNMYLHSLIFIFSSMSSKNRLLFMYKKKPHDPVLVNFKYIIFIDKQQKKIFHEHVCFYFVSSFDESSC